MRTAGFLDLPKRESKPRRVGLTHLLDKGLSLAATDGVLRTASAYVDIWKFGWGTAYLDPDLDLKLALLAKHDVRPCLGGTLLEVAWLQGKAKECLDWAAQSGFGLIEVSRGVAPMSMREKTDLIEFATQTFTVLSEVGSKDPAAPVDAAAWAEEVELDLTAGAWMVVAEGRESGTVGLYQSDGQIKADVANALVSCAGVEKILFETPRKDQQAWFIGNFGADVGLANVATDDLLGVEALRLGLRADTVVVPSSGS